MRQSNVLISRLSTLFYNIFKIFLFLNGIMLILSIYNICGSSSYLFRSNFWITCILVINFWVLMSIFFLLSICYKLLLGLFDQLIDDGDNQTFIHSLMLFPLMGDENDLIQAVLHESANTEQPSRSSPTSDKIIKIDLKWGFCMKLVTLTSSELTDDNKCLICANALTHTFPDFQGCVRLECNCNTIFHRKCILEWFHFNENEDDNRSIVTCPSCRHAFTTTS